MSQTIGRAPTDRELSAKSGLTVARLRFLDKCVKTRQTGSFDALSQPAEQNGRNLQVGRSGGR